jgi:hypothetical protein
MPRGVGRCEPTLGHVLATHPVVTLLMAALHAPPAESAVKATAKYISPDEDQDSPPLSRDGDRDDRLFVSLGGSAVAVSRGGDKSSTPRAERAGGLGKLTLRFGKLVDKDTTPFDGSFFFAIGHAVCKSGERVIPGGVRQIGGNRARMPSTSGWLNPVRSRRRKRGTRK